MNGHENLAEQLQDMVKEIVEQFESEYDDCKNICVAHMRTAAMAAEAMDIHGGMFLAVQLKMAAEACHYSVGKKKTLDLLGIITRDIENAEIKKGSKDDDERHGEPSSTL